MNKSYHIAFSTVVLMELLSGACDRKEIRLIDKIKKGFTIVGVSEKQFHLAGEVMRRLRLDKKADSLRIKCLLADILIAVSARSVGAVVITKNDKDFRLIREVLDFQYLAA